MSSLQSLRDLVNGRLTAAVEEIFGAIETTISAYEEEFDRQRKRLEVQRKLDDVPQQQEYKVMVLTDQRLCDQERISGLDHVDPQSFDIKEEVDDISISLEGKQLGATREANTLTLTADNGENVQAETKRGGDQQLLSQSSPVGESQAQTGSKDVEINFECKEDVDYKQESPDFNWQPDMKLHQIEQPQLPVSKKEDVLTDHQHSQQHKNQNQQKVSIGPETLSQKDRTMVWTYEETEDMETESNREQQLLSPVDERRDQRDIPPREWGSLSETQMMESKKLVQNKKQSPHQSNTGCNTPVEKRPEECEICRKTFSHRSYLNVHMRIHTGEKPFACGTCGKRFTVCSNLNNHMRIHTGEKPFSCEICGRCFIQRANLNHHMRTHTGEKPFSCETCGKRFIQRANLNHHTRTHTGEKPFSCEICGKHFAVRSYLNDHRRTHTGEKPFSCETCGKCFTQRANLNHHMRKHAFEAIHS